MTGPRQYFAYRSDDGKTYILRHNRSHLEAVGIPTCQFSDEYPGAPGDLRPRYVVARHPNGRTTRQVIVDDVTRPAWTGGVQMLLLPDWASAPSGQLVGYRITLRVAERISGTRTTRKKRILPRIEPRARPPS